MAPATPAQEPHPSIFRLSDTLGAEWDNQFIAQPADPAPADAPPRPATIRTARTTARDSYVRLARAPNMFGDTVRAVGQLRTVDNVGKTNLALPILLAGAANYNIAQNNKATPTDRAYFLYNGFYRAINFVEPGLVPRPGSADLHLYTAGIEKTFLDGLWSVDLRMPFTSGFQLNAADNNTNTGQVGNLSMFFKRMAYSGDELAVSGGLGIGLPTGSDIESTLNGSPLVVQNEAVHLMPFMAMTYLPNDDWFVQGFTSLDFAASGNEIVSGPQRFGVYTEQHLLHFDVTVGYWLAQEIDRRYLEGIAAIVELHYTTTIHDTDRVPVTLPGTNGALANDPNRIDLLNLTAGIHLQLAPLSNLRVGAVVPLRAAPDRLFDSELQVSFNRLF
jgi:hypothetical protein